MEGHIASLPRIVELAEEYGAFLVVDDCHGFGVLGRDGRGVADHFGLTDQVDLICGSFSKSLASTGGFIAADRGVIEYLRSSSQQIIFSAAITPAAAATALASLRVMQREPRAPRAALGKHALSAGHPAVAGAGFLGKPDARRAHRHRRQGEAVFHLEVAPGAGVLYGDVDFARRAGRARTSSARRSARCTRRKCSTGSATR